MVRNNKYFLVIISMVVMINFISCIDTSGNTKAEEAKFQVSDLTVKELSGSNVMLSWKPPEEIDNVQNYIVRFIDVDNPDMVYELSVSKAELEQLTSEGYQEESFFLPAGQYSIEVAILKTDLTLAPALRKDNVLTVDTLATPPDKVVIQEGNISSRKIGSVSSISFSFTPPNAGKTANNEEAIIENYIVYWMENVDDFSIGYADNFTTVSATTMTDSTQHAITITDLKLGVKYAIRVQAVNNAKLYSTSDAYTIVTAEISTESAPEAVKNFTISSSSTEIKLDLSWDAAEGFGVNEDETSASFVAYRIYLAEGTTVTVDGTPALTIQDVSVTSASFTLTDDNLKGNTEYAVAIVVVGDGVLSTSEAITRTAKTADFSTKPSAISGLQVDATNTAAGQLSLTWTAASAGQDVSGVGDAEIIYEIYYAEAGTYTSAEELIAGVGAPSATVSGTSFTLTGLEGIASYDIVVVAVNKSQLEKKSDPIMIQGIESSGIKSINILLDSDIVTSLKTDTQESLQLQASIATVNLANDGGVKWTSSDSSLVNIANANSNPITLNPLTTGTVTITAESLLDSSITATVTLKIYNFGDIFAKWTSSSVYGGISDVTTVTKISTVDQLKAIGTDATSLSGTYYLSRNIYLDDEDNWVPIGTSTAPFTGKLFGNGNKIFGLKIAGDTNSLYQGLFGKIQNGTVRDLGIAIDNIVAGAVVGVLTGYSDSSSLKNIAVAAMSETSAIRADGFTTIDSKAGGYVGGIVGYMNSLSQLQGYNLSVPIVFSAAITNSEIGYVGGLVGINTGVIDGVSFASVTSSAGYVGGLVGMSTGASAIVRGIATGDVSMSAGIGVGGLAGRVASTAFIVGIATGNVTFDSTDSVDINMGGLIGINDSAEIRGIALGNVESKASNGGNIGGFLGGNIVDNNTNTYGYSLGWVIVTNTQTQATMSQSVGLNFLNSGSYAKIYYNSEYGDRVGTISGTTTKNSNTTGIAINGVSNATTTNMSFLSTGSSVGQWVFETGKWPQLVLPSIVTAVHDVTIAEPAKPANFVD